MIYQKKVPFYAIKNRKLLQYSIHLARVSLALTTLVAHAAVLDEVIVEAQKKVESVQETPIAISSMSGAQFQQTASFNLSELSRSTPGLSIDTGSTPDIHLRGTSTVALAPVSLRTNIYVDGALVEQPRNLFSAQYDISRFEVLKGPQGTLYGKSSPTGTINIRTQNPNLSTIDGYVAGSAGQRDLHNAQFGISLPIIENELGVRIAAIYDEAKNGVKNVTNGSEGQSRASGTRFTALWEPNDALTARLSYTYNEFSNIEMLVTDGQGYSFDDDKTTANLKDKDVSRDQLTVFEINYALGDHQSLTSVTAYEVQTYQTMGDTDGTASVVAAPYNGLVGGNRIASSIISPHIWQEDLRLASEDNDFWDWQLGGYYKYANANTPVAVKQYSGVSIALDTAYIAHQEEFAAYTHQTFKLTDEFNLIVGLRASRQRLYNTQPTTGCLINGASPDDGVCLLNLTSGPNPLLTAEGVPDNLRTTYAQPITGTLKAQYFFNVDLAGYISFDRAYRSGSANLNVAGNLPNDLRS